MKKILMVTGLLVSTPLFSQDTTRFFTLSGYAETYYQYDFNKPPANNRPAFIYSHNRHNEFNLNLGFIKANYTTDVLRANMAFAAGTYMNANYTAEPDGLKNILEANAGVRLGKNKNLWLDAGIFPSHIGFESALSKDCWNLTRSILADNSPYFEAGAKITYTSAGNKWVLSALVLNGWQRITRVNGNSLMSWGAQVQYKPSGKVLFNYSNFIGTDSPDSVRLIRFFHNIYGIFSFNDKFGLTLGCDVGTQEKSPTSNEKYIWYSPVMLLKYAFSNKWVIAGRLEYYRDKNGVIIPTGSPNGFQTIGYSFNIDHSPAKDIMIRLEVRNLSSKDNIFLKQSGISGSSAFITSSVAVSF